MADLPFQSASKVKAKALCIAERITLKTIDAGSKLSSSPLIVTAGASGCVALFKYGAVVLFNLHPMEEMSFIDQIKQYAEDPFDVCQSEEIDVVQDSAQDEKQSGLIDNGRVYLKSLSLESIQLISEVLAQSVILAHYETRIGKVFDHIEPLAADLKRGTIGRKGKEFLSYIGEMLLTHHKVVGRVEVAEKPDLLWDHPEFERIFLRLADEFELKERNTALERKLTLITQTVETLQDVMQTRQSHRLEWYIVILILVEIVLTFYQLFFLGVKH